MDVGIPATQSEGFHLAEQSRRPSARRIVAFVITFFGLWALAWLIRWALDGWWQISHGSTRDMAYWAVAKCLVWVVFPFFFWGGSRVLTRAGLAEQLAFIGLLRGTAWRGIKVGLAATAIWLLLSLAVSAARGVTIVVDTGPVGLYAILVTPTFEEVMFRGFIQWALAAGGLRFWLVNVIGAVLFLMIHCLGWAFQGVLVGNLFSAYPFSLLLLSLVLGYTRHRSDSLWASLLLHIGNNAFSSIAK
jgi:membrane protease YdiL (CAAX protease family)